MAKVYYTQVKNGSRTLDEVPQKWRAQVRAMLDAESLAAEGE